MMIVSEDGVISPSLALILGIDDVAPPLEQFYWL